MIKLKQGITRKPHRKARIMNEITVLPLGALATNCYIVPADEKTAIVIDPAATGEVEAVLASKDMRAGAIIVTHGHFDHFAGAARLRNYYGAPIYAPELDSEMLASEDKSWAWFMGGIEFTPIVPDFAFENGEHFTVCGLEFSVMAAPGHTAGSCLLFCEKYGAIFAGDVLFKNGCGRTDGFSGSDRQMLQTLREIAKIPGNYAVYPGHGETTTLAVEKARIDVYDY